MKKIVSFVLVLTLLATAAVIPFSVSASASEVYYDSDVVGTWWDAGPSDSGTHPLGYSSSHRTYAGFPTQGADESDEDFAVRYANAEKTITFTPTKTDSYGKGYFYKYRLNADADYSYGRHFKVTLKFKRTGSRDEEVQIWPTLMVASGKYLKEGNFTPSTLAIADGYTDFINSLADDDEVLYFNKGVYRSQYFSGKLLYPICILGKTTDDTFHEIEYIYYIVNNTYKSVRVRSIMVDGIVHEVMPTTAAKNALTQDENTILQTYCSGSYLAQNICQLVYAESGSLEWFCIPPMPTEGEAAGLCLSKIKYEGMVDPYPLDITGVSLDGTTADLSDGTANRLKAAGKAVFHFESSRPDAQVTLQKSGESTVSALSGVWNGNDCTVDFAENPLTPEASYTLTVTSIGQSQSVSFTVLPETLDFVGAKLDGTDVEDYTQGNTLSSTGQIELSFTEAKPALSLSLVQGTEARVAPQGVWTDNKLTIDFQNAPLRPNSAYTLTASLGTESQSITFTTGFDGFYVNDNFALYATDMSFYENSSNTSPWYGYTAYNGAQLEKIVEESGRKALQINVAGTTPAASQFPRIYLNKTKLPQLPAGEYASVRTAEINFSFPEMESSLRLGLWTDAFFVQKDDEANKYYLYVTQAHSDKGEITGMHKLCELATGEHTVRFAYSCDNGASRRYLHRLTVDGTDVNTTAEGRNLLVNPIKLDSFNTLSLIELSPYMTSGGTSNNNHPVFFLQNVGTAAAPTTYVKLYGVKYSPYATDNTDYVFSATKSATPEGISVTINAQDFKGEHHAEYVIVASYQDAACQQLLDAKALQVAVTPITTYNSSVTLAGNSTSVVKVFRLRSADSVQPISAAVPVQ